MCEDLNMNGTAGEWSFEQFLVAIRTYMVVQVEAAKQLFEKEPAERTAEAYMRLIDEQMEEISRGIAEEAPGTLPGLGSLHKTFQELLRYNLNRQD